MSEAVAEMEASGADPEVVALAKKKLEDMRNRDQKLKNELQVLIACKMIT